MAGNLWRGRAARVLPGRVFVKGAPTTFSRPRKTDRQDRGDEDQEQPPIQDPGPNRLEEIGHNDLSSSGPHRTYTPGSRPVAAFAENP